MRPVTNSESAAPSAGTRTPGYRPHPVMTSQNLRASFQLVSSTGAADAAEIRDSARNNVVVFSGTYEECVAEAKRRGIWYR